MLYVFIRLETTHTHGVLLLCHSWEFATRNCVCEGRTSERSKRLFRYMHRPSALWYPPFPTRGGLVTASPLARTHSTVARSEWWDSPTVLHAPFAPNLHASRTETSLEPVVVCAQSSPDRRRTVCVARPRRSSRPRVLFPRRRRGGASRHTVFFPFGFSVVCACNRQADRQTPSPPPPHRLPFAAIACTYSRSPPPPCTLRAAVKK